jgi:hypothetical protein
MPLSSIAVVVMNTVTGTGLDGVHPEISELSDEELHVVEERAPVLNPESACAL